MKEIIHSVPKNGTVGFNADYAAKIPVEQFVKEQGHQYPNLSTEDREKVLKQVHERAVKEVNGVKETANGNDSGNAGKGKGGGSATGSDNGNKKVS